MIQILHNPRCRKSREGLAILEASGKEFEIVKYLDDTPDAEGMREILKKLGINAEQLLRKNEAIWKEQYKGKEMTESEIIDAMVSEPKLIERPIVIDGQRAVLGRPPEHIAEFLGN